MYIQAVRVTSEGNPCLHEGHETNHIKYYAQSVNNVTFRAKAKVSGTCIVSATDLVWPTCVGNYPAQA